MKEKLNFSLMRHSYDDHSYIDGKNNTDLTHDGIKLAKEASVKISEKLKRKETDIEIISTSKIRGIHTAEILKERLDHIGVNSSLRIDKNFRELYQGEMDLSLMNHEDKIKFLESGWISFDKERRRGNNNYHFGEPHSDLINTNIIKPPYGESQNDFSNRIMKAIKKSLFEDDMNVSKIIITHRGGMREILNAVFASNNNLPFEQSDSCEMAGLKYCDFREVTLNDRDNFKKIIARRLLDIWQDQNR